MIYDALVKDRRYCYNLDSLHTSRALVKFLGVENMVAIICRSRSAATRIGVPHLGGALHENPRVHGIAKSCSLLISGRFRVIALQDESRCIHLISFHFMFV